MITRITLWVCLSILAGTVTSGRTTVVGAKSPIRIHPANPSYWEYDGKPLILLGGSTEDNPFNHPDGLSEELDRLKAAGGNYVRNTMSSRNPGNRHAFKQLPNGLYDLDQWDEEYWVRFENFLRLCAERDIIAQLEIWDPWDYFLRESQMGFGAGNTGWESTPFNPRLNINYTEAETGVAEEIDYHLHTPHRHLFFQTPPALADIPAVLKYQNRFVEKLLSTSLNYPNVLYNMRNECRESAEWARYWARFIREKANQAGRKVFLTDMRRAEDFTSPEQLDLLHDRVHFDFIDVSQNSHNKGQAHYDQIMELRAQVMARPIPMNNVKIYGGTAPWTGGIEEGTHRFWRNIFSGCAAVRFHRPGPSEDFFGIGLSPLAQTHIRSARLMVDAFDVFGSSPRNELLDGRAPNEAFCLAKEGAGYAVYFPDGGQVILALPASEAGWHLRWLDISKSQWSEPTVAAPSEQGGLVLKAPGRGAWIGHVVRQ